MIRYEEMRLRRAFRPLLLLSLGAPGMVGLACGSSSGSADPDASISPEGGRGSDAGDARVAPDLEDATVADAAGDDAATGTDGAPAGDADASTGVTFCADGVDAAHPRVDGSAYLDATDDGGCDFFLQYTGCAPAPVAQSGDGCYFTLGQCTAICGRQTSAGCFVTANNCEKTADGGNAIRSANAVVVACTTCLGGRRPEGMAALAEVSSAENEVGAWFARLAHMEGASIAAFRTLRAELLAHGAPEELISAATQSAKDEVRHTRATARLARRFGGTPELAVVRRGPVRSLEQMAIENAAEGCVRETFGALVAEWQAAHAEDRGVRSEMATIAADETRHAALAWAVARWAEAKLDPSGRARVAESRRRAVRELYAESEQETPQILTHTAGLPPAHVARALLDGAARTLWAA